MTVHHVLLFLPLLRFGVQHRHTEAIVRPLSLILKKKNHLESVKKSVLQKIYYIYLYIFYMNGMLNIQPKNQ